MPPTIAPIGNEWNPPAAPFGPQGWNFVTLVPSDTGEWSRVGSDYVAEFVKE